jgi:hypothetical protein
VPQPDAGGEATMKDVEVRLQLLRGVIMLKGRRSNGDLVHVNLGGIWHAPGLPVLSVSSMNRSKSALIAFKCSSDALPCRLPHLGMVILLMGVDI